MAMGTVKFFRPDQGWGAIACTELPPGCDAWVHYSVIEAEGFRALVEGERVEFDYETAQQDSFRFRATRVRRIDATQRSDPYGIHRPPSPGQP